ncbi:MAG TPA: NAD(P)/FAD-dependent oxidoreductase [Burkholderiales bacterium]|nr:NAD(P)/FAD-dependent oxidoreductase [Burkholderiales bacterium]
MTVNESDIVVIGAGHNALVAAAYLGRAGLSVTVLEARSVIGGGSVTEELTVPGFRHDTFSSGHPWLLTNPLFTADELGIFRDGVSYVGNDPVLVVPFPDGESLTIWRDARRTAAGIERYSKRDAAAWLALHQEWRELSPAHLARVTRAPSDAVPVADPAVEARYSALLEKSCRDVVHERFDSEHVRGALLWFGMVAVQPIDRAGTGLLAVLVPVTWCEYGWLNVVGGSLKLAEGLARVVTGHGGCIVTGARVEHIPVENGRVSGARTADGRFFRARRAVISSMHFTALPRAVEARLPEPFLAGADAWRSGPSLFVVHLALRANPRVRTREGALAAVLAGQSTARGVDLQLRNVREQRLTVSEPWMLMACSTWIDPSRAPEGQATVKLITFAPYALEGDPARWDAAKADYADFLVEQYARCVVGFRPGDELGRHATSPYDIERTNASYHRGAAQGGEMVPDQMGLNRPVRGWADYRMPVAGLYQTGTSSHPGGPVSGWPGRHAARAVLEDLGMDWRKVMSGTAASASVQVPVVDTSRF